MTDPTPTPDDLEPAVRAHLERLESAIDPSSLRQRLQQRSTVERPKPLLRILRWGAGSLAVAAALLIGLLLLPTSSTAVANPETVIREARRVADVPGDRCYRIETDWGAEGERRFPFLGALKPIVLWTRGDRFYLETTYGDDRKSRWGRDEQGQIWLAPTSKIGLQFGPNETVEGLSPTVEILSMKLDALLGELLWGFDLKLANSENPMNYRVLATAKPFRKNAVIREVQIEIHRETKRVEQVSLVRLHRFANPPLQSRVTFSQIEDAFLPDDRYRLEGHLDSNARILGSNAPNLRADLLNRFLNRKLIPWPPVVPPEKKPLPKGNASL